MAITRFAAVDIGAYNVELKIFEITREKGIVVVDHIKKGMDLGKEIYRTGKLSFKLIEELCEVLYDYLGIINGYKVAAYEICGTGGIRGAGNIDIILDRIKVRTGFEIKVLSNSEQRYLSFKAFAACENIFAGITKKPAAIVEVGSMSTQISIFDNGVLIATNNIKLGSLRIRELISDLGEESSRSESIIDELLLNDLRTFGRLHLKERKIENVVAIGGIISEEIRKYAPGKMEYIYTPEEIKQLPSRVPCMRVYNRIIEQLGAKNILIPGTDLCDGMAVNYGTEHKKLKVNHDFENDILEEARNICKRYGGSIKHIELMLVHAEAMFDALKKYHGLTKRDRLLLSLAAILHDCGKYISMTLSSECSYNIIMATEIIGLSHKEREIVANVVRYNVKEMDDNEVLGLSDADYLKVAKLVAILRVCNAMDRSHKQKYKNYKYELKGSELIITANTDEDISLEKSLFKDKADYFEEVYGIKPVLKKKRN